MKRTVVVLLALLAASLCPAADVKYTMEMKVAAGMPSMTTTVYMKGNQQRSDMNMMGMGQMSTITQCDQKQTISIGDRCKAYYISTLDDNGLPVVSSGGTAKKGGVVKIENTIRDTGERQQMLGHEARHLIVKITMDGGPGSCTPGHSEIETDTWVIDMAMPGCVAKAQEGPPQTVRGSADCQDRYEISTKGAAGSMAKMGLPVKTTMTVKASQGAATTMTMEVKELSTATLDASLFQPPTGYKQVNAQQDVIMCGVGSMASGMAGAMAAARQQAEADARQSQGGAAGETAAKPAGIRIGVVFSDRSGKMDTGSASGKLIEDIGQKPGFDAVRIEATSPAEIQSEAVAKQCTFILYADVQEAKTGMPSVRGLLGRATGSGGSAAPTQSLRMDYRLTTVQPPNQQVAKDTLSHSEQTAMMGQATDNFMQKTADRATADASRAKK